MIKFFRTIRRSLLQNGKLKSYILYAIGEIILVVLGILIALQINNWNEVGKTRQSETQFKENIKFDLTRDQEEIRRIMDVTNQKIQIFTQLQNELPDLYYNDKDRLDSLMREYLKTLKAFWPLTSVFDAAVSSNEISTYTDKDFKSQVYTLYNAIYVRLNRSREIIIDRWDFLARKYKYERHTGKMGQMNEDDIKELIGDLAYITKTYEVYQDRLAETELEIQHILNKGK